MKRFVLIALSVVSFACFQALGQIPSLAPNETIEWNVSSKHIKGEEYQIILKGKIAEDWHVYGVHSKTNPVEITFGGNNGYSPEGKTYELSKSKKSDGEPVFYGNIEIARNIILEKERATVNGTVSWVCCNDKLNVCGSPEYHDFSVIVKAVSENGTGIASGNKKGKSEIITTSGADTEESEKAKGSIWALIVEAILWGFAMLLTPCVFPMVPMTVSFFMKGSSSPAAGRFRAFMYGIFIILLYTVPISLIILITRLAGGDVVTADIFNWLATHWLPNILFFIIFMIFAASFFGAFEITLPSSLVNKSDKNSDKKGLAGIFFMALTLVLVSFSCTGPIVGSVLIKSTQGEFWTPMVTMLAFSVAFALPFTILAMFPSLLKKMKSGSWLNSVKVVLGFVEIALGFKFLSVADQTYHWGLLDRDIYLAIWIVTFTLLGFYLLGKIRFPNDEKVEHLSVPRLFLVIVDFTFVVYLIPGMFGAPLKALSGYLPPLETQDFILYNRAENQVMTGPAGNALPAEDSLAGKFDLKLPLGLNGYFKIEDGLSVAKKEGKPVFVDITGHGCVNCREMESRVWSDPEISGMLRNDFIIVALYTDDKTKLDKTDWITADNGTVLKDLGRVNSYIVRKRFGVNAQPNYAILSPEGKQLVPIRGYNLSIEGFKNFLRSGIDAYNKGND
ncbi:MAG: thioredoxin family protein [Bacteroidales bacterium]|jgi:thiol:disulfide interchange protein DsbD|nr:thioredoxin family protein [Bacteroidales bacterium]